MLPGQKNPPSSPSSHWPSDDNDDDFLSFDPNDFNDLGLGQGNDPKPWPSSLSTGGEDENYFSNDDFLNFHPNGSEVGHENEPPAWSSEDDPTGSNNQAPGDNHKSSSGHALAYGHISTAKPVHTTSPRHPFQTASHRTAAEVAADEALAASYFGLHPTIASTSGVHNSSSSSSQPSSTATSHTSATSRDPDTSTASPSRTLDPTSTFSAPTPTTTSDPDDRNNEEEENSDGDSSKPADDAAEVAENAVGDTAGAAGAGAAGAAGAGGSLFGGLGSAIGGLAGAGAGIAAGVGAGAASGHHNDKPPDPVTVVTSVATPIQTAETQAQNFGPAPQPNTSVPTVPDTPEMAGLNLSMPQTSHPTGSNHSTSDYPGLLNTSNPDSFNASHHVDPLYNATMPRLPFEPLHNNSSYSNPFNTSHNAHPHHNETIPTLPFEHPNTTFPNHFNDSHHIHPLHNLTNLRSPPARLNTTFKPHHIKDHHNQTTSHHNSTRKPNMPPVPLNFSNHTKSLHNSTRPSRLPFRPPNHLNASHPVHTGSLNHTDPLHHTGPLHHTTNQTPAKNTSSAPHTLTMTPAQHSFCSNFAEPHYSALTNISDDPSAAIQTTCGGPISNNMLSSLFLSIYKEVQGNKIDFPMNGQPFKYHKEVGGVSFDYTGVNTGLAGAIGAWNLLKPTINYYFLLWHEGFANAALSWISKTVPDHLGPGHARALGKPVALGSPIVKVTICQKGSECPTSSGVGP